MSGDIVINTYCENATVTGAVDSLFAARGLAVVDTGAESDLVIDEFDQWRNPEHTLAAFSIQTFNLVVVPQRSA